MLFALSYEVVNLQILAEAMPKIAGEDLVVRLRESPSGLFIRKACYLWEWFANGELSNLPAVAGPYGDLFDPADYVTGIARKDAKRRINFNGLGSAEYCPVVRLTQLVKDGIASDVLGRTKAFLESLGPTNADRTLSWAYLSETDSFFAIEWEAPSQSKAVTFFALLQQAHEKIELTQEYLADLHSATISNPYEMALSELSVATGQSPRCCCFSEESLIAAENFVVAGLLRKAPMAATANSDRAYEKVASFRHEQN